jgi:hypothetical protein
MPNAIEQRQRRRNQSASTENSDAARWMHCESLYAVYFEQTDFSSLEFG